MLDADPAALLVSGAEVEPVGQAPIPTRPLDIGDTLTIATIAVARAWDRLGRLWTPGGNTADLDRPICHEFTAVWAAHDEGRCYIGWRLTAHELYSAPTRLLPPPGVCNACYLFQHKACELPLTCRCAHCHRGLPTSGETREPD